MRLSTQQKRMRQKGQATLEFIILVPFIFTMILIIALAGWWSYTKLSAQNAAYAWTVWNSTIKPSPKTIIAGDQDAIENTLHSPKGMKEMWGETVGDVSVHPEFKWYRRGGFAAKVWIFPGEIWPPEEIINIIFGKSDVIVPRGTSFFFYAPFTSAEDFEW